VPGPCEESVDGFPPVPLDDQTPCDDGVGCTLDDRCINKVCYGLPDDDFCDDGEVCTGDTCNDTIDCVYVAIDVPCDDGQACTSDDACDDKTCVGQEITCDDQNPCTTDLCDPASGCVHAPVCTTACGCVTECPVTADGVPCDDGDLTTIADFCFAGECGGFKQLLFDGIGYEDNTIVHLESTAGTLYAVGRETNEAGQRTTWVGLVEPGQGLAHVLANEVTELNQVSAGLAVGDNNVSAVLQGGRSYPSLDPAQAGSSTTAGLFKSDPNFSDALAGTTAGFKDIIATFGSLRDDGTAAHYMVGRKTANRAAAARCDFDPGSGTPWTCQEIQFTHSSPGTQETLQKGFFPQEIEGVIDQSGDITYLASLGTFYDSSQEFKYTIWDLPLFQGETDFRFLGGWYSVSGSGFVTDLVMTAVEVGKLWVSGINAFLATLSTNADITKWSWKSTVLPSQSSSFIQGLAATDRGTFAVSERVKTAESGIQSYNPSLHFHPAASPDPELWITTNIEYQSYFCTKPDGQCPLNVTDAWSLHVAAAEQGRIVIGGTGFDGGEKTRILERVIDGSCAGTLFAADFDDGTLGDFVLAGETCDKCDDVDTKVSWHPAPEWTPPGGSGAFRGTAYYGDPVAKNYVGDGQGSAASLTTPVLAIPQMGETFLRFALWTHTESLEKYDRFEVHVTCKSEGCPVETEVFNHKMEILMSQWRGIEIPLAAYAGKVVEIRFEFNTYDNISNTFTGVFLDAVRVVNECAPTGCDCDDGDPCTVDGCWAGRCLNVAQCVEVPLSQDFESAVAVQDDLYMPSIGWVSETWLLASGGELPSVHATVDADNFTGSPVEHTLTPPPLHVSAGGAADMSFAYGYDPGALPGSGAASLELRATGLTSGDTTVLWSVSANGAGGVDKATIDLSGLGAGADSVYQLHFVATAPPSSDVTWRLDSVEITAP